MYDTLWTRNMHVANQCYDEEPRNLRGASPWSWLKTSAARRLGGQTTIAGGCWRLFAQGSQGERSDSWGHFGKWQGSTWDQGCPRSAFPSGGHWSKRAFDLISEAVVLWWFVMSHEIPGPSFASYVGMKKQPIPTNPTPLPWLLLNSSTPGPGRLPSSTWTVSWYGFVLRGTMGSCNGQHTVVVFLLWLIAIRRWVTQLHSSCSVGTKSTVGKLTSTTTLLLDVT